MNQEWRTAFHDALTETNIHSVAAPGARNHFCTLVVRKTLETMKIPERRIKWLLSTTEGTPRKRVEACFKRQE